MAWLYRYIILEAGEHNTRSSANRAVKKKMSSLLPTLFVVVFKWNTTYPSQKKFSATVVLLSFIS